MLKFKANWLKIAGLDAWVNIWENASSPSCREFVKIDASKNSLTPEHIMLFVKECQVEKQVWNLFYTFLFLK